MDENNEMSQAMSDEQYFQELRQRINAKAENLVKTGLTGVRKNRWIVVAVLAVIIAIFIAAEVYSYVNLVKNDFWELNAFLGIFFGSSLIIFSIMSIIMRRNFTRMKNASSAPQYYREVKRLITTHKLRQWLPLVFAVVCTCKYDWYGNDSWLFSLIIGFLLILGPILGSSMRNWFLDDDFRFFVVELGDLIHQQSPA